MAALVVLATSSTGKDTTQDLQWSNMSDQPPSDHGSSSVKVSMDSIVFFPSVAYTHVVSKRGVVETQRWLWIGNPMQVYIIFFGSNLHMYTLRD